MKLLYPEIILQTQNHLAPIHDTAADDAKC